MIEAYEVSLVDKDKLSSTMGEYAKNLTDEGRDKLLHDMGDILVMAINRYAPRGGVGAKGGKLATTAYYDIVDGEMKMYLQNYWPYVEFDTKHTKPIVPKKPGGVLAFPDPKYASHTGRIDTPKDKMIFTKKVDHPGTTGQFFIAKSWNRSKGLIEEKLEQYAKGNLH